MNRGKTLDRGIETLSLELAFSSCIHFKPDQLRQTTFMQGCIGTSLFNKQHGGCKINRTPVTCIIGLSTTESQKAIDIAQCINWWSRDSFNFWHKVLKGESTIPIIKRALFA